MPDARFTLMPDARRFTLKDGRAIAVFLITEPETPVTPPGGPAQWV